MNARPMLSRIAAATFRRMCGLTTPISFTVPPSLGDPGTPARQYASPDACKLPRGQHWSDCPRYGYRDAYVHTSVSHDTAHAADNDGGPTPTDLADTTPFRDVILPNDTAVYTPDDGFGIVIRNATKTAVCGGPGRLIYLVRDRYGVARWFTADQVTPAI